MVYYKIRGGLLLYYRMLHGCGIETHDVVQVVMSVRMTWNCQRLDRREHNVVGGTLAYL
jgi:hypothetical protein